MNALSGAAELDLNDQTARARAEARQLWRELMREWAHLRSNLSLAITRMFVPFTVNVVDSTGGQFDFHASTHEC